MKLAEKLKKLSGDPGTCFHKNLHAVMAILVLVEYFSGKFCFNFLTLILSASPNMKHFVRTFSIMRAEGVRLIVNRRGSKLWKNCKHQKYF